MTKEDRSRFNLTRRKILGSLGALGAGTALSGAGSVAFLSDTEQFTNNNLVSGELDLRVDWEEHYSDWSEDELEAAPSARMVASSEDLDNGEVGLPTAESPLIAVSRDEIDAFMKSTAVEAFPDEGNDAIQDAIRDPCGPNSNLGSVDDPDNPVLSSVSRTNGTFAGQSTDPGDPLINLQDVKPGDFGEVTVSLHLCDNPGFIWMNGNLDADLTSENGKPEPEANDPDEQDGVVELLNEMRAAVWLDTGTNGWDNDAQEGDNIKQDMEPSIVGSGSLKAVLNALNSGEHGIPLDGDPEAGSIPTTITPQQQDAPKTDFECVEKEKPEQGIVDCTDVNPEWLSVKKIEADNLPAKDTSKTYDTSAGSVTITTKSTNDDQPVEITFDSEFPVRGVLIKGGPNSNACTPKEPNASTGTKNNITLTAPTNPNNNRPFAISNVQFCILPGTNGDIQILNGNRDCLTNSTTAYVGFAWWVPVETGNEIQTDTVGFDLGFYTEQCRHNDGGAGNVGQVPPDQQQIDLSTGEADWKVTQVPGSQNGTVSTLTSLPMAWANPDCADWIDPFGTGDLEDDPEGLYKYEVDFTVPEGASNCSLKINKFGADNKVELFLDDDSNGPLGSVGTLPDGQEGFSSPLPGDISKKLSPGQHTLIAEVENGSDPDPNSDTGNPTGLIVCAEVICENN